MKRFSAVRRFGVSQAGGTWTLCCGACAKDGARLPHTEITAGRVIMEFVGHRHSIPTFGLGAKWQFDHLGCELGAAAIHEAEMTRLRTGTLNANRGSQLQRREQRSFL